MSSAGVDAFLYSDASGFGMTPVGNAEQASGAPQNNGAASNSYSSFRQGSRRTPRKSVIVVLPDNHVVSADLVANRLPHADDNEIIDVILACAGPPLGIGALQRRVRDLQVLLAPAGTSSEDLRELAMSQAPGDIITLLSGTPVSG